MHAVDILERGREAFDARAWPEAYERLDEADGTVALEPTDLERLATAAYLTGNDEGSADAWGRAHRAWQERGEPERAVRCAFWLGFGFMQRGEMAQGGGWLARADRLVAEHDLDSVERGYLMVPAALMAMGSGEPAAALEHLGEADALARRFGDRDLAAFATLGRGQALLGLGRQREGLGSLDEVMVSVTAGETSPTISGIVYCAVIDTCQRVHDLRRAREWTLALDRWCGEQPGLVPYRGQCLVHRAQMLQTWGEWEAATTEAERARRWLSDPPHPALGMALYQLGELHRLRGEASEAEDAFRRAHASGRDPQPGLALLRLAEGAAETAAAAIAAALEASGTGDGVARAALLPAYAEIMIAAGRTEEAAAAADELDALARDAGTMLGAVADSTRGRVLLGRGDAEAALGPLRAALDAWQQLGAPYEVAELRLLLAGACRALHDVDRAGLECEAARDAFHTLGAAPALARLEGMLAGGRADVLTARELDVLRLVAEGRTNRVIASELSVSEKTVERHLGTVFTKLGVANRASATAEAYHRGLL